MNIGTTNQRIRPLQGAAQVVREGDDRIDRSVGTPAFTAPECCAPGGTFSGFKYDAW